ncbi:MAG TPA: MlaD family protein [Nocardioides sp.]|nr:MlaD family protein [Nocardioides sp.]
MRPPIKLPVPAVRLSAERRRQRAHLVKLCAFLVLASVVTLWVAAVTGQYRPGHYDTYTAIFKDVSGLSAGDAVRIAGVDVGKVDELVVQDDNTVRVTFGVRTDQQLTVGTHATVQYRNLTGDRIILLTPGRGAALLGPGGTIPVDHTAAALDLDTLLNGFRPLFAGLSPSQINELSGEVVQVLQGQQSAVAGMVGHVASFTTTIGQRAQLIGEVIRNLNSVLGAVDKRSTSVGRMIGQLNRVMVGLNRQDTELLDAAGRINAFAGDASTLVVDARGDLTSDLKALFVAARGIDRKSATLESLLAALPVHYRTLQDVASYGNFFNTFLCGLRLQTDLGTSPWIRSDAKRCQR